MTNLKEECSYEYYTKQTIIYDNIHKLYESNYQNMKNYLKNLKEGEANKLKMFFQIALSAEFGNMNIKSINLIIEETEVDYILIEYTNDIKIYFGYIDDYNHRLINKNDKLVSIYTTNCKEKDVDNSKQFLEKLKYNISNIFKFSDICKLANI